MRGLKWIWGMEGTGGYRKDREGIAGMWGSTRGERVGGQIGEMGVEQGGEAWRSRASGRGKGCEGSRMGR